MHARADHLLQRVLASPGIVAKGGGVEAIDACVIPAVRTNFMAGCVDVADEGGRGPGEVADHEECRPRLGPGEQFEQPPGGDFHALAVFGRAGSRNP